MFIKSCNIINTLSIKKFINWFQPKFWYESRFWNTHFRFQNNFSCELSIFWALEIAEGNHTAQSCAIDGRIIEVHNESPNEIWLKLPCSPKICVVYKHLFVLFDHFQDPIVCVYQSSLPITITYDFLGLNVSFHLLANLAVIFRRVCSFYSDVPF